MQTHVICRIDEDIGQFDLGTVYESTKASDDDDDEY